MLATLQQPAPMNSSKEVERLIAEEATMTAHAEELQKELSQLSKRLFAAKS